MSRKSFFRSSVAGGALMALCLAGAAEAKTVKKPAAAPAASAADLEALRAEVEALKSRLDQEGAANAQQSAQLQSTQAELAAAKAQAGQAQAIAQASQQKVLEIPAQVQTEIRTEVAAAKPKTDKIYYKGVSITLNGFAELASIYRSHDETADISSSFSKIPFHNDKASRTGEFRFSARQSRYSALIQGDISPTVHAGFYGEFDFQGGAQTANSNQSDSYNPRIRHIYGQVDWDDLGWHLLAGQNWSLVTMNTKGITPRNELTPPQIDAQYVPGFAWARQPQVRLTKDFNKEFWVSVSAENPQTTFGNIATASGVSITNVQAPTNGYFNGANYSLNKYPDVVGKVALEEKLGGHALHLEAFGLWRSFYDRVSIAPAATNQAGILGYTAGNGNATTYGGGVGGGLVFELAPKLIDVEASVLTGSGIGRYGSAGLPDVTARPDGSLQAIPETMWLAGGTLHATPMLDVYLFGGQEAERSKIYAPAGLPASVAFGYGALPGSSNAGCAVEGGTCSPVTKSIDQITAGFWDKLYQGPFGRVQIGMQYSYTERKTFADSAGYAPKGTENMVFTSIRYYPF